MSLCVFSCRFTDKAVIEAVFEEMVSRKSLHRAGPCDEARRYPVSNTSTLTEPNRCVRKRPHDDRHCTFQPSQHAEVRSRAEKTGKDVLATDGAGAEDQEDISCSWCVRRLCGNHLDRTVRSSRRLLLDEGCTPAQVDKARKFGFAMGPFSMGDLAGNDIGFW
jgi:3-hydroxyacyl-CoA dehydrogenase